MWIFLEPRGPLVLPISSKSVGGFTKVWGGTLNIFNNEELRLMNINQSLIEKYKFILDKLKLDVDLEINPNNSVKNFNKSIYENSLFVVLWLFFNQYLIF